MDNEVGGMGLNNTPNANRIHIGIFGKRNAGKSSLINSITGQETSIVSDVKGTTTDPVRKAMELLPLGSVLIIDTPGLDDVGDLGSLRVEKVYQILNKVDIALLVVDGTCGISSEDIQALEEIGKKKIPCILVINKKDLLPNLEEGTIESLLLYLDRDNLDRDDLDKDGLNKGDLDRDGRHQNLFCFSKIKSCVISTKTGENVEELKELIGELALEKSAEKSLVGDVISASDFIVLVTPIDESAPKGRLILPQQQVIRDVLEHEANCIVVKETQVEETLRVLKQKPALVITDSQVFELVDGLVPSDIPLTSFSILFARFKGVLETTVTGALALDELCDGDKVLISEGCTHHRQCNDIGTVKLPRWISEYSRRQLDFAFTSGTGFPRELSGFACIVHCGGCMLNEREVKHRMESAMEQGIPFTNYGIAIAKINGILERSIKPFGL